MTKGKTFNYSVRILPSNISISIPLTQSLPRKLVPQLCEQIHSLTSEKKGVSFYYPNIAEGVTTCRYEWNYKRIKCGEYIRLGLLIKVSEADLNELTAYISTNAASREQASVLPKISKKLIDESINELVTATGYAIQRLDQTVENPLFIIFHVEMPYQKGIGNEISTEDGLIRIFPTRILKREKNKRVSAISISSNAKSFERGRDEAVKSAEIFCALITLAEDSIYKLASIKMNKKNVFKRCLNSIENINLDDLYPQNNNSVLEELDSKIEERLNWVWNQYNNVPREERELLTTALLTYYAGRSIQDKQPTLSLVSYIAVLNSLAKKEIKKCPGSIVCSRCGTLPNFNHNLVGDRAAIESLICELLEFGDKPSIKKELKKLIKRLFGDQRSAFVHDAKLRHREFQKDGLPLSFPTVDNHVSDLFVYANDLRSLEDIVRRILLKWIAREAKTNLDPIFPPTHNEVGGFSPIS
jgi:hypothetical protein